MKNKIFQTIFSKGIISIINFLVVILTAQYTGLTGRGEISLMFLNVTVLLLINDFIGGGGLVYLASRLALKQIIYLVYSWALICGIAIPLLIFLLLPFSLNELMWLIILSVLANFSSIMSNLLNGKEKIKENNWGNLAQVFILFTLLLVQIFILKNNTPSIYYSSLSIGYLINFLIGFWFLRKEFFSSNEFQKTSFILGQLFHCGWQLQLGNILQLLNYRLSYYFIGIGLENTLKRELGIFSTANSVAESAWVVMNGISMVQYAKISSSRNARYAAQLSVKLAKLSLVITVLLMTCLNLLPPAFFGFIFGKGFEQMKSIIYIISPGVTLLSLTGIYAHYFAGMGLMKISSLSALVGLISTLTLSGFLIPRYGIYGAAITTTVSYFFSGVYLIYMFRKKTDYTIKKMLLDYNGILKK